MAANITNPIVLAELVLDAESINTGSTAIVARRCLNRSGAYPAAGGYAAGITMTDASANYVSVATEGIAVVTVEPSSTIALDAMVTPASTNGRVKTSNGTTDFGLGRALDTSDGTGTTNAPHYIRVRVNAN